MPEDNSTPLRAMRIPDERWAAADRAARRLGTDRTKLVNQFLAWFTREPGAKPVKRPDVEQD